MLAYDATLEVWARALEKRKHETEGHVRRVTEMTVEMAGLMHMTDEQIMHVRRAARPYRNAWTDEETWDYIDRQTGLEFDPEVVKLFTETHKKH
jgi:response regulator RpfG family c-di-GMP phosphodiesterase